jgi:hypothetical protein
MRSGTDAEMFWTGTEDTGGYGMMTKDGEPQPVFHAKRLCAQYIRYGDWISFPTEEHSDSTVDAVVARSEDGRLSGLFVHLTDGIASCEVSDFDSYLENCPILLKIDEGTGNRVVEGESDGTVCFEGYGVAVVTNARSETDLASRCIR